jgi:hypothetical protein
LRATDKSGKVMSDGISVHISQYLS